MLNVITIKAIVIVVANLDGVLDTVDLYQNILLKLIEVANLRKIQPC